MMTRYSTCEKRQQQWAWQRWEREKEEIKKKKQILRSTQSLLLSTSVEDGGGWGRSSLQNVLERLPRPMVGSTFFTPSSVHSPVPEETLGTAWLVTVPAFTRLFSLKGDLSLRPITGRVLAALTTGGCFFWSRGLNSLRLVMDEDCIGLVWDSDVRAWNRSWDWKKKIFKKNIVKLRNY